MIFSLDQQSRLFSTNIFGGYKQKVYLCIKIKIDINMKREEYISKYTKEVTITKPFNDQIIVSTNEKYLTNKGLLDKDSLITILAKHDICYVDSSFANSDKTYPVANIGLSKKENKWYGWSHRAIYGFTIGSECKKGCVQYNAKNKEDYIEEMLDWWKEPYKENMRVENMDEKGFDIVFEYRENFPKLDRKEGYHHVIFPKHYGKGEWIAETIDDAKQMAIDFANNIA